MLDKGVQCPWSCDFSWGGDRVALWTMLLGKKREIL